MFKVTHVYEDGRCKYDEYGDDEYNAAAAEFDFLRRTDATITYLQLASEYSVLKQFVHEAENVELEGVF